MNSLLLPTFCMALAVVCQTKLAKLIPFWWQSATAIIFAGIGLYLFQATQGWWWALPFWLTEFMAFSFVWVLLKSLYPRVIPYGVTLLGVLTVLWLMFSVVVMESN